jgi:uncharacterized cupredoxin-like copper-binding protein
VRRTGRSLTSLLSSRGLIRVVALGAVIAGAVAVPMAGQAASGAAKATVINVTAGKPTEFQFTLSTFSNVKPGVITFKVTNKGVIGHTFEICTKAIVGTNTPNSCKGKVTKLLQKGQSQTITVTKLVKGTYEFLCTFPGHAAGGMKGLLGVGVKVTAAQQKAARKNVTTTTTTTTTTPGGTTTTPVTTPATTTSGGTTTLANDGCPAGFTIQTYGATDNDLDETGASASDGDGCV